MHEILEQLGFILEEGDSRLFVAEVEILMRNVTLGDLNKYKKDFPKVVKEIKCVKRFD